MKRRKKQYQLLILLGLLVLAKANGLIGTGDLAVLILILCAAFIAPLLLERHRRSETFNKLALDTLHGRTTPDQDSKVNGILFRSDPNKASLIRTIQIIRDSVRIALTSKKRDTAESRMKMTLDLFRKIKEEHSHLIKPKTFAEVTEVIENTESKFRTRLYVNVAQGYLERLPKLKTEESRVKYIALAKGVLNEGLSTGQADVSELNKSFQVIESIEKQSTRS